MPIFFNSHGKDMILRRKDGSSPWHQSRTGCGRWPRAWPSGLATAQVRLEAVAVGPREPLGRELSARRPLRGHRAAGPHAAVVGADGKVGAPIAGLPAIAAGGQGGLLDGLADSGFDKNRTLYFCFSEPDTSGGSTNSTALARAQLSADGTRPREPAR